MPYPEIPHLAWPLELLPNGALATVEQDTIEDIEQCVHVLLKMPAGSRPLAPLVGRVDDETFIGTDADELETRLTDPDVGEPRAVVSVTVDGKAPDQTVSVEIALAETQEG